MIEVKKYSAECRAEWNRFLATCKNRHFMFHRDYMEYHADRYHEYSQLLFNNGKLVALLPANLADKEVISHGWLTFGGVLCDSRMTTAGMLEIFDALLDFFRTAGIQRFTYKAMPHIYHQLPAEEDLYALFRHRATLYRRDVSSAIDLSNIPKFTKGKKWSIKKAEKVDGLTIEESDDFENFWRLLNELLDQKYEKRPVHNLSEIVLLQKKFPDNIKLFGILVKGQMVGGTVVFENEGTIHTQYIASNDHCREIGGLDALFAFLITERYADQKIFDFGISNEQDGWFLNAGLASFKEGFGARSIVHDFYRMEIA